MIEKTVVIKSKSGLHARPCNQIATMTKNFDGTIQMISGTKQADLKSVINIMALGVKKDSEVLIRADGQDEENMVRQIVEFIEQL